MKLYGLTGGIGAGKSAAAEILRNRGVMVTDTDHLARQLVEPGQPALVEIVARFGNGVLQGEHLDRRALARIAFGDEAARKDLEGILHPRIRQAWETETQQWRQQGCPVGVVVIPLLFETNAQTSFDAVICLGCSEQTQRQRLYQRGWSDVDINQRISSQLPLEKKMNRANYVIWNEGDLDTLAEQLDRIIPPVKPADYFLDETAGE
ncbi:MAG TPA: dephospho-CoA kinase [Verrucomicrobiae bacterium]